MNKKSVDNNLLRYSLGQAHSIESRPSEKNCLKGGSLA